MNNKSRGNKTGDPVMSRQPARASVNLREYASSSRKTQGESSSPSPSPSPSKHRSSADDSSPPPESTDNIHSLNEASISSFSDTEGPAHPADLLLNPFSGPVQEFKNPLFGSSPDVTVAAPLLARQWNLNCLSRILQGFAQQNRSMSFFRVDTRETVSLFSCIDALLIKHQRLMQRAVERLHDLVSIVGSHHPHGHRRISTDLEAEFSDSSEDLGSSGGDEDTDVLLLRQRSYSSPGIEKHVGAPQGKTQWKDFEGDRPVEGSSLVIMTVAHLFLLHRLLRENISILHPHGQRLTSLSWQQSALFQLLQEDMKSFNPPTAFSSLSKFQHVVLHVHARHPEDTRTVSAAQVASVYSALESMRQQAQVLLPGGLESSISPTVEVQLGDLVDRLHTQALDVEKIRRHHQLLQAWKHHLMSQQSYVRQKLSLLEQVRSETAKQLAKAVELLHENRLSNGDLSSGQVDRGWAFARSEGFPGESLGDSLSMSGPSSIGGPSSNFGESASTVNRSTRSLSLLTLDEQRISMPLLRASGGSVSPVRSHSPLFDEERGDRLPMLGPDESIREDEVLEAMQMAQGQLSPAGPVSNPVPASTSGGFHADSPSLPGRSLKNLNLQDEFPDSPSASDSFRGFPAPSPTARSSELFQAHNEPVPSWKPFALAASDGQSPGTPVSLSDRVRMSQT